MWAALIVLGVALALQPLPVLAVVVLLSVDNGIRKATAFFLGEFVVLLAIAAATVALQLGKSHSSTSTAASYVTLVAGLLLGAAGVWIGVRARRRETAAVPGWMARLDRMQPWPAFLLGLFLPTYVIAVAAGAHIVGRHPGVAVAVAGMLVFLGIGTSTVYGPILLARFAPERSEPARVWARDRLQRDWQEVGAILLLAVGAFLVVKAILELT